MFNDSVETLKKKAEYNEARELLFKALQIMAKEDDRVLADAEEYLKGSSE